MDCARIPLGTGGTLDAFMVQPFRDLSWRRSAHELAKYALDDRCFDRLNFSLARRDGCACERPHDSVAVAQTTTGLSGLDSATQSAVCLHGEILQVQGVHRALEPDVQVRDVAFGERDDIHTGEGQAFEQAAVSSWSRLKRSSDSASTTSNWRFSASRINA